MDNGLSWTSPIQYWPWMDEIKMTCQLVHGRRHTTWMSDVLYVCPEPSKKFIMCKYMHLFWKETTWCRLVKKHCCETERESWLVLAFHYTSSPDIFDCSIQIAKEVASAPNESSNTDLWLQTWAHVNVKQICQVVDQSMGITYFKVVPQISLKPLTKEKFIHYYNILWIKSILRKDCHSLWTHANVVT